MDLFFFCHFQQCGYFFQEQLRFDGFLEQFVGLNEMWVDGLAREEEGDLFSNPC